MAKPATPGARSALGPHIAEALKTCLSADPSNAPVTAADLEAHDPRFVGRIVDQIRRGVDDALYRALSWTKLNNPIASTQFVVDAVNRSEVLALLLSTSGRGYIREAAVHRISNISGPFALALLVNRLNDWVPNVRRAAEARLRQLSSSLDHGIVAACIEYLGRFDEYGRASDEGRDLVAALLADEATISGLRDWFAQSGEDRTVRVFQLLMRTPAMDDLLVDAAVRHKHPRVRAMAAKALLEAVFPWRARTLQKRSIVAAVDRMALAHQLLEDRSTDVQHQALQYLSQNMEDDAALEAILLRYLLHPRRKLSEVAQWKLGKRGADWLSWVRAEYDKLPHDATLARLLGRVGTEEDGDRLWRAVAQAPDGMRWFLLLAATRLKQDDAVLEARRIVLHDPSITSARAAAAALLDAGEALSVEDLDAAAESGQSFARRGLLSHLHKHRLASQLRIFCRLEAHGAPPQEDELGRLSRRLNVGAFDPSASELDDLRRRSADAPRVAGWMRRLQII